jgi:hypothetical protein
MINNLIILFSIVAVGFTAARAAYLDRMLPWFKPFNPLLLKRRRGVGRRE